MDNHYASNPSSDKQQQITHLKTINDKLLHKYVALVTNPKWVNALLGLIIGTILLVPAGIFANLEFGLNWPVIIAFWVTFLSVCLFDVFNTYPLYDSNVAITPIPELRKKLLRYSKLNMIATAICLPVKIGITIWLASEVRHILNYHFLGIEFQNKVSIPVFWGIIIIGVVISIFAAINAFYSTPNEINGIVADMDEYNCNDIVDGNGRNL